VGFDRQRYKKLHHVHEQKDDEYEHYPCQHRFDGHDGSTPLYGSRKNPVRNCVFPPSSKALHQALGKILHAGNDDESSYYQRCCYAKQLIEAESALPVNKSVSERFYKFHSTSSIPLVYKYLPY